MNGYHEKNGQTVLSINQSLEALYYSAQTGKFQYCRQRGFWNPLVEIFQGDKCHLSPVNFGAVCDSGLSVRCKVACGEGAKKCLWWSATNCLTAGCRHCSQSKYCG